MPMLIGIDPQPDADLLRALREMGHGDMLILADRNFPAVSLAPSTTLGRPLRMAGTTLAEATAAILDFVPLDAAAPDFAVRMAIAGQPDTVPPVQAEVQAVLAAAGENRPMAGVERYGFYDLAREAFAIIRTGERRFYGCVMLRKGVFPPGGITD
jgi:L-fucose mutarotase